MDDKSKIIDLEAYIETLKQTPEGLPITKGVQSKFASLIKDALMADGVLIIVVTDDDIKMGCVGITVEEAPDLLKYCAKIVLKEAYTIFNK